jgi:predicted lipoprotein with Yx(FWY)xxD motif
MKSLAPASLAAALLLALVGCGTAARPPKPITPARGAAQPPAPARSSTRYADPPRRATRAVEVVRVAHTAYGRALTDRRGQALYLFTRDGRAVSRCYGACAAAWPPYLVAKAPAAAGLPAHTRLLGAIHRRDGRLQVTYAGHPLYYYVGDRRPRQVLCQAVAEFGGTWYVVSADGRAIR